MSVLFIFLVSSRALVVSVNHTHRVEGFHALLPCRHGTVGTRRTLPKVPCWSTRAALSCARYQHPAQFDGKARNKFLQHLLAPARRPRLALFGLLAALTLLASGCGVNVTVGPAHVSFGNGSKHRKHHVRYLAYNVRGQRAAHTHTHTHSAHRRSAQSVYAGRIVAVLDSSAPVFDQAASRASSTQGPDLADLCNQYGSEINILESQFEGVPHPYAWYSRAGWLLQ